MIQLFNEDCIETMKRIPDGSIDLMLTDPPYGVTACEWDIAPNLSNMWFEWERIVKADGLWIFSSQQPFTTDLIISRRGFYKHDIIWEKHKGTNIFNVNREPLRIHEHILIFSRGNYTYNPQMENGNPYKKRGSHNVGKDGGLIIGNKKVGYSENFDSSKRYPLSIKKFSNHNQKSESLHPTQKPEDLMRYLILTYSNEGDTVFDGYSGSGTTAIACIKEKRNFIGSELNKEYFDKAALRIKVEQMQTTLF